MSVKVCHAMLSVQLVGHVYAAAPDTVAMIRTSEVAYGQLTRAKARAIVPIRGCD